MTDSVVKQDPNTEKVQKNAIHCDKTQHANSRGKPLFFKLFQRKKEKEKEKRKNTQKNPPFQAT